eukprot:CAMPEP_0117652104 /NCGR_PEP_ID=MMETSP0804-20121206/2450_1 /TAXON_ID=1074897 /ORGANISM="Tetraselmis astigmatica, Strain CCMP880" /LENGTH=448 /DNA_ID=CAMNT_0005458131 /DNA_START=203 /DNA_END=1550 /DNA_ORIENTATION=+
MILSAHHLRWKLSSVALVTLLLAAFTPATQSWVLQGVTVNGTHPAVSLPGSHQYSTSQGCGSCHLGDDRSRLKPAKHVGHSNRGVLSSVTPPAIQRTELYEEQTSLPLGPGCLCGEDGLVGEGLAEKQQGHSGPGAHADLNTEPSAEEAREFLQSHSLPEQQGQRRPAVLLVMANKGNRILVDNLLCSLKAVGIASYVLFAADRQSYRFFRSHGYSGAFYDSSVFPHELSPEAMEIQGGASQAQAWADLLRSRVSTVKYVVDKGFDVLFVDADVSFNRDVVLELQLLTEHVDAVFMWDGPTSGRQYPAWAAVGGGASSEEDDQTIINKVLVQQPPLLSYSLLDNSTFLCGHTLKTAVKWPGHRLKASKGPAKVSHTQPVAVVHVNWTGSLAEKKRLLLHSGFWHLCKGVGLQGYEARLRAAGQWFDAESLARPRKKRPPLTSRTVKRG